MTRMPTTFPAQNSHRAIIFQPDLRGTDFDRVEDIAADALAALREAVDILDDLPYDIFKPLEREQKILRDALGRRRILNDPARDALADALQTLARMEPDDATTAMIDRLMRRLRDALNASHRVADLLAAERDVGWHRGLRD